MHRETCTGCTSQFSTVDLRGPSGAQFVGRYKKIVSSHVLLEDTHVESHPNPGAAGVIGPTTTQSCRRRSLSDPVANDPPNPAM